MISERRNLESASCLHALGEQEVVAFRDLGLRNPIATIPNGIPSNWINSEGNGDAFRSRQGIEKGQRLMLSLSRITPIKGLPLLLKSMASEGTWHPDWLLLIAGPDEFGHANQLKRLARELRIEHFMRFVGPLYGEDRRDAYAASELFVLPTLSEGSPVTVLEALGVGVPVLTTTGAPCAFINDIQAGWQVNVDSIAIASALREALRVDSKKLAECGMRGREYVASHFLWDHVCDQLAEVYAWLLGKGDQPPFVSVA